MIIAVSATEADYNSAGVDPRFGRCTYFITYNTETDEWNSISNSAREAMGGAAIQAVDLLKKNGVDIIITGNLGPNATSALKAAGIEIIPGVTGKVKDAVESHKK